MNLSDGVKPISYFKAHASEVINEIVENQNTMIITQNGEAKVIIQDIHSYEQMQESMAMLKLLAISTNDIRKNRVTEAKDAFSNLEQQIQTRQEF